MAKKKAMKTLCGLLALVATLAVAAPVRAQGEASVGTITVSVDRAPPSEAILYAFDAASDTPRVWGWMGTANAWRDIGMSFECHDESEIGALTLHIGSLPAAFTEPRGFTLRLYEGRKVGEAPNPDDAIYTAQGTLILEKGDSEAYLRFELDRGVPAQAGLVYTFLLSWDEPSPSQVVGFQIIQNYSRGRAWYRDEKDGAVKFLSGRESPGLEFFVQHK